MNRMTFFRAALVLAGSSLFACGDDTLGQIGNHPPLADAGGDRVVELGAYVSLDGSRSSDPDGDALEFAWHVGDGDVLTGESAGRVFATLGAHEVTLTVTDPAGASASDTIVITVTKDEAPPANAAPVADIVAPLSALVGETVTFDGSGSSDDVGVESWTWDLGGTAAAGATIEHVFDVAGTIEVTLLVTDAAGLTGTAIHTLTVEAIATEPTSLTGTWSWTLVDEAQRNLGFTCGTFYDSTLLIDADAAPTLTITEQASVISNTYTGSLTGMAFDVAYGSLGVEQRIFGTFASETTFSGTYSVVPLGQSCADRAVTGTRTGP